MAKRQRSNQVTASYHYVVQRPRRDTEADEVGFSAADFSKLCAHLSDVTPINFKDDAELTKIKHGEKLSLLKATQISKTRLFGQFEAAYYGQEYRNTQVGKIDAESVNLRTFHYVIDHRRDGRIVIGNQYLGNFGDYEGLSYFITKILTTDKNVVRTKSFTSLKHEIGNGTPVELKVSLNKPDKKLGGRSLFSRTGVFAIKGSDYGDDFEADIRQFIPKVKGSLDDRKAALARIISQGDLMDIDDEDIADCTVVMRKDNSQYTVYIVGGNNISTKFPLGVHVPPNGLLDYDRVRSEMERILNDVVTPGLRR